MALKPAAFAYLRTSSAANVGADKDSEKRQRAAIQAFAKSAGYDIADEFYDAAVSGADPVDTRPGFAALLKRVEASGVATIIVETASRFARDLMVQEVGFMRLGERGIELIAADSPTSFQDNTPTAKLVRQVLGAIAEFDKAMTVAKLRGARDRKRASGLKVEGRKGHAELRPETVMLARKLRRASPKTGKRRSLREIALELEKAGHLNERARRYAAASIKNMLKPDLRRTVSGVRESETSAVEIRTSTPEARSEPSTF